MENKEKDLYLAKLLEKNAIKQDEFEDIEYKPEINAFDSKYLKQSFVDKINFGWSVWQEQATPEGFVLVPKTESTGLTDKKGKIIFVGDVVEFVGGCRDFLDLSGCGSSKYIVNKGDKMIVRKLKSGYTLSLPWIDCDTPNRVGNLGNYDFWSLQRDFVVIEAQEQSHDSK